MRSLLTARSLSAALALVAGLLAPLAGCANSCDGSTAAPAPPPPTRTSPVKPAEHSPELRFVQDELIESGARLSALITKAVKDDAERHVDDEDKS